MTGFARLGSLIVLVRDGAERERSQGEVRIARDGRVRLRYRVGDRERRQLAAGVAAAARIHLAAGAMEALTLHHRPGRVRTEAAVAGLAALPFGPNRVGLFSAHVNGTCRLGRDRRISGCTPDGERYGVRGLYVADGSLLPTAPGVNPQETIMAVATVVARRIHERHAR
jgi:choline dehydrogenase-like flavoprotein